MQHTQLRFLSLSLLLVPFFTKTERNVTFDTSKREKRGGIEYRNTGLTVAAYLVAGAAVSKVSDHLLNPEKTKDTDFCRSYLKETLVTPHDVSAIAKLSTTSFALANIANPEMAEQFRRFGVRAPIAAIIAGLAQSKGVRSLLTHLPFYGEALQKPSKEMLDVYPMAGQLTTSVVTIGMYMALDPVITWCTDKAYEKWCNLFSEEEDDVISEEKYSRLT